MNYCSYKLEQDSYSSQSQQSHERKRLGSEDHINSPYNKRRATENMLYPNTTIQDPSINQALPPINSRPTLSNNNYPNNNINNSKMQYNNNYSINNNNNNNNNNNYNNNNSNSYLGPHGYSNPNYLNNNNINNNNNMNNTINNSNSNNYTNDPYRNEPKVKPVQSIEGIIFS